jgi:hypothetical protein
MRGADMLHLVMVSVTTFILSIPCSHAEPFRKPVEQLSSDELNALVILPPEAKDHVDFDQNAVSKIAQEIGAIKAKYPELATFNDHEARPGKFATLIFSLDDNLRNLIQARLNVSDEPRQGGAATGRQRIDVTSIVERIPALEKLWALGALNRLAEASVPIRAIYAHNIGRGRVSLASFLTVDLQYPINIKALRLENSAAMGDGKRIRREAVRDDLVRYFFFRGSGDCQAGCLRHTIREFRVDPKTLMVAEEGHERSATENERALFRGRP